MKYVFIKIKESFKTHKKRILSCMVAMIVIIIISMGGIAGFKYSHAKANINYSQDQLEKVALEKVPGQVMDVEKKLDFRHGTFEYEFKIKDKNNILKSVRVDCQYGSIVDKNRDKHMEHNNNGHVKHNNGTHRE